MVHWWKKYIKDKNSVYAKTVPVSLKETRTFPNSITRFSEHSQHLLILISLHPQRDGRREWTEIIILIPRTYQALAKTYITDVIVSMKRLLQDSIVHCHEMTIKW